MPICVAPRMSLITGLRAAAGWHTERTRYPHGIRDLLAYQPQTSGIAAEHAASAWIGRRACRFLEQRCREQQWRHDRSFCGARESSRTCRSRRPSPETRCTTRIGGACRWRTPAAGVEAARGRRLRLPLGLTICSSLDNIHVAHVRMVNSCDSDS